MEFEAAKEYVNFAHVNYSPCGLVIHPQGPWLGTSPDGLVYDPTATPTFGLVEIKCPNVKSYVECKYLSKSNGSFQLRKSHAYSWQVRGQLLITGLTWCDFFVLAEDDFFVQRLHEDKEVQDLIRYKCDQFYFHVFMQKYLSMKRDMQA